MLKLQKELESFYGKEILLKFNPLRISNTKSSEYVKITTYHLPVGKPLDSDSRLMPLISTDTKFAQILIICSNFLMGTLIILFTGYLYLMKIYRTLKIYLYNSFPRRKDQGVNLYKTNKIQTKAKFRT